MANNPSPGEDQRALLAALPEDGETVSNPAVQRLLDWNADRYYAARDALVDAGLVVRGRGKGGTVRLAPQPLDEENPTVSIIVDATDPNPDIDIENAVKGELALYAPMRDVIEQDWARDHRSEPLAVEITAMQGRRPTGGRWSRPDIASVEIRTFEYVPGKHLEVSTFEVKPASAINVQAVYEALAHRRAATRSYVIFHVPPGDLRLRDAVGEVSESAQSHGVGVVAAGDPGDYQTWEDWVDAERAEPDPEHLNAFIAAQLSDATRKLISLRLR